MRRLIVVAWPWKLSGWLVKTSVSRSRRSCARTVSTASPRTCWGVISSAATILWFPARQEFWKDYSATGKVEISHTVKGRIHSMTKRCPQCNKGKALSSFGVDKCRPSGRACWCLKCNRDRTKKYYERISARAKITIPKSKRCSVCKKNRPAAMFHRNRYAKNGLSSPCKGCSKEGGRFRGLMWKYGISREHFEMLLQKQKGVCAICEKPEREGRRRNLSVDHDHSTDKIRGLLCHVCNRAVGLFNDDPSLLETAAHYLREAR